MDPVAIVCTVVTTVPISLSMIIVGALNYSECNYSQAALFLILTGSAALCMILGLITLQLAGHLAPSQNNRAMGPIIHNLESKINSLS